MFLLTTINHMAKLTAAIKRADGFEIVKGTKVDESTSFYKLKKEADRDGSGILEWFAKDGPRVKCVATEEK
jgi:hypothetical protein